MKRKAIISILLGLNSLVGLNNSYADSAFDPQTVTLNVPEVALFDVETKTILVPATEPGQGFSGISRNTRFAITSNVEGANTRVLNARIDQILSGIDFKVLVFPAVGTYLGQISLSTTDQAVLMNIGNAIVDFGNALSLINYTLSPQAGTPPQVDTIVNVTYTLTDDA